MKEKEEESEELVKWGKELKVGIVEIRDVCKKGGKGVVKEERRIDR